MNTALDAAILPISVSGASRDREDRERRQSQRPGARTCPSASRRKSNPTNSVSVRKPVRPNTPQTRRRRPRTRPCVAPLGLRPRLRATQTRAKSPTRCTFHFLILVRFWFLLTIVAVRASVGRGPWGWVGREEKRPPRPVRTHTARPLRHDSMKREYRNVNLNPRSRSVSVSGHGRRGKDSRRRPLGVTGRVH